MMHPVSQPLTFYNTLYRAKEIFEPQDPNRVTLYTCGPTVYDYAHIGNLRTYIFEDLLRRTLEQYGYRVEHAMNITDVGHLVGDDDEGEDKIELRAKREGKSPTEIARYYETKFFDDLKALNVLLPAQVMRATEAIPQQIQLIQDLEARGFVYVTKSAVYFDTAKLEDYGKLTGQNLAEKTIAARSDVVVDPLKRNPQDFALWFFLVGRYEHHLLHWPSPWGEGFPGWHVECSAISRYLLGQPFDIHTGGVDHIGTHHTNEIAQSEAAYGVPLARYWLHGEFLLVDGHRMSKSEGNFTTLDTLKEEGFSPLDFRYFCLGAHYRSKLNFTWEALEGAKRTLQGIRQRLSGSRREPPAELVASVWRALADDLDTPKALALLHEANNPDAWQYFDPILGLNLGAVQELGQEPIPSIAQELVSQRDAARARQDWGTADTLRKQLLEMGYIVIDTPEGSRIERVAE